MRMASSNVITMTITVKQKRSRRRLSDVAAEIAVARPRSRSRLLLRDLVLRPDVVGDRRVARARRRQDGREARLSNERRSFARRSRNSAVNSCVVRNWGAGARRGLEVGARRGRGLPPTTAGAAA